MWINLFNKIFNNHFIIINITVTCSMKLLFLNTNTKVMINIDEMLVKNNLYKKKKTILFINYKFIYNDKVLNIYNYFFHLSLRIILIIFKSVKKKNINNMIHVNNK